MASRKAAPQRQPASSGSTAWASSGGQVSWSQLKLRAAVRWDQADHNSVYASVCCQKQTRAMAACWDTHGNRRRWWVQVCCEGSSSITLFWVLMCFFTISKKCVPRQLRSSLLRCSGAYVCPWHAADVPDAAASLHTHPKHRLQSMSCSKL